MLALFVAALWSEPVRAADERRDAWLLSAHGARAALMLGPMVAFVPQRALDGPDLFQESGRFVLCTDRGCEVVTARRRVNPGEGVYGLELTVERPLADVPRLTDAAAIRAAMRQSIRFADEELVHTDQRMDLEYEMPNSLAIRDPPIRRRKKRGSRQKRSSQRKDRPKRVRWSEPSRWTGEYGTMGGLTLGLDGEQSVSPTGFATMRAGFRYHRRIRRGDIITGIISAAGVMAIGNQVGADLRVHYLGLLPEGHQWAVTTHPILAAAFPDRRAFVAGRATVPLGLFAIGVGGVGRDVGLIVQYGMDLSMLVTPRFGLDFRLNMTLNTAGSTSAQIGLGGFFR